MAAIRCDPGASSIMAPRCGGTASRATSDRVTANLREPEGRDLVRRLAGRSDVVIENFRPGRLEAWGLGFDDLKAVNPRLILARVSGFGQTGPYSPKPGYASVAEGYGGLRLRHRIPGSAARTRRI